MNEIRKNIESEEELIRGTFKVSPGAVLIFIGGLILFGGPFIGVCIAAPTMTAEVNGQPAQGWFAALPIIIFFGLLTLFFLVSQILKLIAIYKSELIVTNKRVYGTYHILIARKNFSYRLDEVDNVEMVSSLGQHTLAMQFTQGHGPTHNATVYVNGIPTSGGYNMLRMSNLKNYKEVFEVLNNLITSRKNLIDVQTDIEMGKLDAENKKANALDNMAKTMAGSVASSTSSKKETKQDDYISELRKLKELLDEGIITQEEFDQEKKEILANNHK